MNNNVFEFKLLVKEGDSIEKSVYKFLRRAVYAGYFQPGERLIESTLAQRLNVSRTPLREAVKRLETEGLVHIIPNRGATVVKSSPEEIEERYFIVGVVEGLAAYFAMDNIKKEDIERMKEIEVILEDEECQKDYRRWLQFNDNFHNIFVSASNKPLLIRMLEQTKRPLARYWYLACTSPGMAESCISGHSNILEAFSERNAEKVRTAAEKHLFEVGGLMKKHLTRISVV
ncbi:MAG: GntR family transcriptional regulator [Thermodesulfobacteriota bacterium]|nr:GntR family transcriptional regulator [Thermodesulfobacteriota bacterium]